MCLVFKCLDGAIEVMNESLGTFNPFNAIAGAIFPFVSERLIAVVRRKIEPLVITPLRRPAIPATRTITAIVTAVEIDADGLSNAVGLFRRMGFNNHPMGNTTLCIEVKPTTRVVLVESIEFRLGVRIDNRLLTISHFHAPSDVSALDNARRACSQPATQ